MCVCIPECANVLGGTTGDQKKTSDHLELELRVAVGSLLWVLWIKLRSSARAMWWFEWKRLPICLASQTLDAQLVVLLGEVLKPLQPQILLGELCHWRVGLESFKALLCFWVSVSVCFVCVFEDVDSQLPAPVAILFAFCHFCHCHHDALLFSWNNNLNKLFFLEVSLVMESFHTNR